MPISDTSRGPNAPGTDVSLTSDRMNKRASPLEFAPAPSLTDLAYARVEELIITLRLAPGSAISESELTAHTGIGRTPIREALQRLARGELVAAPPGGGG